MFYGDYLSWERPLPSITKRHNICVTLTDVTLVN